MTKKTDREGAGKAAGQKRRAGGGGRPRVEREHIFRFALPGAHELHPRAAADGVPYYRSLVVKVKGVCADLGRPGVLWLRVVDGLAEGYSMEDVVAAFTEGLAEFRRMHGDDAAGATLSEVPLIGTRLPREQGRFEAFIHFVPEISLDAAGPRGGAPDERGVAGHPALAEKAELGHVTSPEGAEAEVGTQGMTEGPPTSEERQGAGAAARYRSAEQGAREEFGRALGARPAMSRLALLVLLANTLRRDSPEQLQEALGAFFQAHGAESYPAKKAVSGLVTGLLEYLWLTLVYQDRPCYLSATKGEDRPEGRFLVVPEGSKKPLVTRKDLSQLPPPRLRRAGTHPGPATPAEPAGAWRKREQARQTPRESSPERD